MARPRKMTGPRRKIFLAQYAETLNKTEAAEAAGLTRHTVNREIEADPEFKAQIVSAEDEFLERYFGLFVKYSMVGVPFEEEIMDEAGKVVKRRKGARIMPAMMNRCYQMIERRLASSVESAAPGPATNTVKSVDKREQAKRLADSLSYDELVELEALESQSDHLADRRNELLARADAG